MGDVKRQNPPGADRAPGRNVREGAEAGREHPPAGSSVDVTIDLRDRSRVSGATRSDVAGRATVDEPDEHLGRARAAGRSAAALATARSWVEAGAPTAPPVSDVDRSDRSTTGQGARSVELPELPELAMWRSELVAELGRSLTRLPRSLHDIVEMSHVIDLVINEEVAVQGLGSVFTYAQQCGGQPVHDLVPRRGHEQANSNAGRVAFGAHTDDALLEDAYRADNLLLVGLDNPDAVPTHLFPIDAVLDHVSAATVSILVEDRFVFACPESFEVDRKEAIASTPRAILREVAGRFHIRFASYSTRAREGDANADAAVADLRRAIEQTDPELVVLEPGQFLTFSNSRFLHGRGPIGGRRWAKRCYLKRSLDELDRSCSTGAVSVYDLGAAIARSTESAR